MYSGANHCWLVYDETQCSLLSEDSKGIDAGLPRHIFQAVVSMSGHHFAKVHRAVDSDSIWCNVRSEENLLYCTSGPTVKINSVHCYTCCYFSFFRTIFPPTKYSFFTVYRLQCVDLSLSERWCQKGESKIGFGKLCKPGFGNFERTSETVKNEYLVGGTWLVEPWSTAIQSPSQPVCP
jgi:hypothetical protein